MDIPVAIFTDPDGFIRRECPNCEQEFKWHHGPANEEAEASSPPPAYYCPLCGLPAGLNSWWTTAQTEHLRAAVLPGAIDEITDELKKAFGSNRNSFIRFEVSTGDDVPEPPSALTEPNDMDVIASPCHSYEPIKVPDVAAGPFHCLICGSPFAV